MENIAQLGSPSQSIGWIVPPERKPTIWLSGPLGYWNSVPQMTQTTTMEVIAKQEEQAAQQVLHRQLLVQEQRGQDGEAALHWQHPEGETRNVPQRGPEQRIGEDALEIQEADKAHRRRARHERLVGHRRPEGQEERRDQEYRQKQKGRRDHRHFLPEPLLVAAFRRTPQSGRGGLLQSHCFLLIGHPPEIVQGRPENRPRQNPLLLLVEGRVAKRCPRYPRRSSWQRPSALPARHHR